MSSSATLRTWASGWVALLTGRISSFRGHVASSLATNVVGLVIAVGTASLLARSLGATGRGEFAAITGWSNFLGGIAVFGIPAAAVYQTSRSPTSARMVLATSATLAGPVACGVAALAWLALPLLLRAHAPEVIRAAQWYAVAYAAANVTWLLPLCTLQGIQSFRRWNASRLFQPLIWAGVLVALALLAAPSAGTLGVGQALSFVVAGLPILVLAHRATRGRYQFDRALVRPSLTYGASVLAASLPQQANRRLDQLLMAIWVEPRSLGIYVVAVNLTSLLSIASAPVAQVLLPRIAAARSQEEQRRDLGRAIRGSMVAGAAMAGALVASGPLIVRVLFGPAFMESVFPLLILAPAAAILSVVTALGEALNGLGRPRDVLKAEAVGLAATCIGLGVTLPRMPILGAAVTSLVSYVVVLWLLATACRRAVGISARELLLPSRADVARLWAAVLRPTEGQSNDSST